jgi:Skp family chaperone for outer membrane proteins
MKVFRLDAAILIAALAVVANAQTRSATPATAASQTRTPALNIAIVDSSAFSDEKSGIARVMNAMRQLDAKFQPLRNELRGMRDRLNTMRADIEKKRAIQDATTTAQQTEEADRLEIQIKRKGEDAQTNYQKESLAMLDPLQKDIGQVLTSYAEAKGIMLLIDVNRVPVFYAANSLDITKDFIAEYNRTHPVTATPATPARP